MLSMIPNPAVMPRSPTLAIDRDEGKGDIILSLFEWIGEAFSRGSYGTIEFGPGPRARLAHKESEDRSLPNLPPHKRVFISPAQDRGREETAASTVVKLQQAHVPVKRPPAGKL